MEDKSNYQKPRKYGSEKSRTMLVVNWSLKSIKTGKIERQGNYKREMFFPSKEFAPVEVNLN